MAHIKEEHFIGRRGSMRAERHDMTVIGQTDKVWHRGPDSEHTLIMVWGKLRVTPTGRKRFALEAGDICDWPAGSEYEVQVTEAPVRFVSIFGPNAGLERFERLCPSCRAAQYQQEVAA